ncbi:hypothetical protein T4B_5890 [Trichinella pseudospiralis]|uniref:Uncharacterized protein n=1 Tax=Trichinella pseudospiralis TaxID=6337 RepID=A0A0V1IRZ3_TRIPS|nr:hypothetical protein T4A_11896 [Trichinella pseudospiralis]KRZ25546.1 hypothetical protein T4B_5890 [Trichinella pseudospiralis]
MLFSCESTVNIYSKDFCVDSSEKIQQQLASSIAAVQLAYAEEWKWKTYVIDIFIFITIIEIQWQRYTVRMLFSWTAACRLANDSQLNK